MIVVLYLAIALAAAVFSAIAGDVGTAWAVVVWSPWHGSPHAWPGDGFVLLALAMICPLRAWTLWQILRGPVVRVPRRPLAGGVAEARLLLYLGVAVTLIPWAVLAGLPGDMALIVSLTAEVAVVAAFTLALTGMPRGFRLAGLALGLVSVTWTALTGALFPDVTVLVEDGENPVSAWWLFGAQVPARAAWQLMMLRGQHGDGRWSAATIRYGALDLTVSLTLLAVQPPPGRFRICRSSSRSWDGSSPG